MLSFLKKIFDKLFTSSTHTIYKEDNNRYEEGSIIKEFLTHVYLNLYKKYTVENKEQQIELLKNSYKDIINFSTIEFLSWGGAQKYEWGFNNEVLIHNSDPYEARFKTDFEKILIELLSISDINKHMEKKKEDFEQLTEKINVDKNKEFLNYLEKMVDTPFKGERRCYETILEKFKEIYFK